jgi:hypothetical protein
LEEMNRLVETNRGELSVVLLDGPMKHFVQHLEERRLPFVDCDRKYSPEFIVAGESHPNGKRHTLWADCIAEAVEPMLRADRHATP